MDYYDNSMELRKAINQIRDNHFSPTEPGAFQDIVNSLLHHDRLACLCIFSLSVHAIQSQTLKFKTQPMHCYIFHCCERIFQW